MLSTMLRLVVLSMSLVGMARSCEVCVAGICHAPAVLLQGFSVTDQLAIDHDRDHSVLYVQLDGDSNTAVHLEPFRIVRLQHHNTSGMAVDDKTHDLYTADDALILYRHGWLNPDADRFEELLHDEADRLFYKDILYYTTKYGKGLHYIEGGHSKNITRLRHYIITDFIVDKNNNIFFVSDAKVFVYHNTWDHGPKSIAAKKYALATDKFGDVYLGDASENAIHKLDESYKMSLYAAYTTETVDRFVFDKDNNIVYHDAASESLGYWKPTDAKCSAEPPHHKYRVRAEDDHKEAEVEFGTLTPDEGAVLML